MKKKPAEEPFENLIRNILIIDPDKSARSQLNDILSELRGHHSGINDASVDTLEAAQDYMDDKRPYLIIIDPEIASLKRVLTFIENNRETFPIWVLNSRHSSWWDRHKKALQKEPFGSRLETYYYMTKGRPPAETKKHLLATLALCQFDFVLKLLEETAEDITSGEVGTVPKANVRKMVEKVNKSVLKLLVNELALKDPKNPPKPGKVKTAFVAMSFDPLQKNRYKFYIKPALEAEGFTPIMFANEYPEDLIPSEILSVIGTCSLFVGDVTNLSSDVLMEVGAALMTKIPKILVAKKTKLPVAKVPFMLKNQRIEFYTSDSNLSVQLKTALEGIRQKNDRPS
jgi:hypothetical protein